MKKLTAAMVCAALATLFVGQVSATEMSSCTDSTNITNDVRDLAASEGAQDLLVRVNETLNALRYTIYKEPPQSWSDSKGDYRVNCTGFVNRMVEDAVPEAYDELCDARDVSAPRAEDYYYFLKSISLGGTRGRWRRPSRFSDARPGDLLVYRYAELSENGTTGHGMILVSVPKLYSGRGDNVYRVRVADAARSGHSNDNRDGTESGVGAGEILVKVNSSGQAYTYTWSLTGPWHSDVYMALGRPRY